MALVVAGDRSGVGKTTVTLALLTYLARQSYSVQSFKVGPDYIDPMFHTAVTKRPCRNLDPVLTDENYVKFCFARHSQGVDYVLVEGVMGLFDGIALPSTRQDHQTEETTAFNDYASTAHIARLLDIPVLLVVDCARMSTSVAAIVHGYRTLDPRIKLAGVVLNRVGSDRHLQLLKTALKPLHLPILGVLRRREQIAIPDRHLGLVPTSELERLDGIFEQLSYIGKTCFAWEQLLPLLQPANCFVPTPSFPPTQYSVRIGWASDRAFNFYYQDNLDILTDLGVQLIPWSPLQDKNLPSDIQGLYFGGGFPEVFASELVANQTIRQQVRQAIEQGMPTYAECGGLMYLCEQLTDFEQQTWDMVGIIPATAVMSKRLTLGYRQATALRDSVLVKQKQTLWGHEFHRSQLTTTPLQPLWQFTQTQSSSEGWAIAQLHASYLHLHWGRYLQIISQFLQHCFLRRDQL